MPAQGKATVSRDRAGDMQCPPAAEDLGDDYWDQEKEMTALYGLDSPDEELPPGDLNSLVDGQRRLQKHAEQLMQRLETSQAIIEGQRRLEQQLEMLTKHLDAGSRGDSKASSRRSSSTATSRNKIPASARGARRDDKEEWLGHNSCQVRSLEPKGAARYYEEARDRRRDIYEAAGDLEDPHDYSDGSADEHPRSREVKEHGKSGGRPGDGCPGKPDGAEHHAEEGHASMQRKALQKLSWRRDETMRQLHGDSLLHVAAWMAEVFTCFLFAVSNLVLLGLWARHVNEEAFVNTFFVTAIAAMTYFAKACHMGDMMFRGHVVPIARYIDWITTTPLMLYELCHIAHATASMTIMVIVCDLLMLATGIIAALVPWKPYKGLKQVWFSLSCFFYILMLVVLNVDIAYKASKQIEVAANLFRQLKVLTVVVWSFYPIVVAIGRANLGLITKSTEDILLCVMDVVAKIGMEGLIVGSCISGCIEASGH